jgi:signal transduction histidine kinase
LARQILNPASANAKDKHLPPAALPADEPERLAALRRMGLLDTEPEERFDRVVRIARALFQVPIAMVTLVDAERQWLKASSGLSAREFPRSVSFCAHAILSDQPLISGDTTADPRFFDNPLVTGEAFIRFYAGVPLRSPDGFRVGTLSLMDRVPRTMDPEHVAMLRDVAAVAQGELGGGGSEAELEAQLRSVTEELEHLLRVKGDLVSVVGHEFRTALTGIQGFSEMMKDGDFTPAEMREFALDIHKDALRLNQMITDTLDLDRLESGRMQLELDSVDINALVAAEVERTRAAAPMNPVRTELDSAIPPAYADAGKLQQVVDNLLSNAVKYSPQGGAITVRTSMYGGMARISVADDGPGVAADIQDAIFERHGRAPTVQTRKVRGTGLGLPLVRQIANLHGGRAWVESSPGFGSTFHFSIPVAGPSGLLEGDTAP